MNRLHNVLLMAATAGAAMIFSVPAISAQTPVPPQPVAPAASSRTEILTYDNWTVTCRDGRDAKDKRVCVAELTVAQEANGQRRVLFAWIIAQNREGTPTALFRFLPGVSIPPGVDFKFQDKPARKVAITTCEPAYCEAMLTMDEAFIRDASAASQAEAVVTASDGRQVTFTLNMKGYAQALSVIRK